MKKTRLRSLGVLLAALLLLTAAGCGAAQAAPAASVEESGSSAAVPAAAEEAPAAAESVSETASSEASGEASRGSGAMSGEFAQAEALPTVMDELTLLADAETLSEKAGAGEMTALFELLGQTWYVARGSAGDRFTVNGEAVEATPVDAAGTLFKWAQAPVAGKTVYGTANVPYADFFYGELNDVSPSAATVVDTAAAEAEALAASRAEGQFDAVTSATSSKWRMQSGTYTEAADSGYGGRILGVGNFCLAADADLFVNAIVCAALEEPCESAVVALASSMTLCDEPAAVYKVLYADGVLSAVAATESQLSASYSVSTRSKYGDYELKASGVRLSGTVLGVVLVTDDGARYGLCHLENIWGNGRELAWYASETTRGRYLPYASLTGSVITEIRYITSAGVTVCGGLALAIG